MRARTPAITSTTVTPVLMPLDAESLDPESLDPDEDLSSGTQTQTRSPRVTNAHLRIKKHWTTEKLLGSCGLDFYIYIWFPLPINASAKSL